jgi:hypothetical protein
MTGTPAFKIVEQLELQRLYVDQAVEHKLQLCLTKNIDAPDAGTDARINHEVFCCKKKTIRYFDPVTGDEVALISYVTPVTGRQPYISISRLRIGEIVFVARLFGDHH